MSLKEWRWIWTTLCAISFVPANTEGKGNIESFFFLCFMINVVVFLVSVLMIFWLDYDDIVVRL